MAGGSVADLDYWRLTRSSASDAASGTCHPGNAASTSPRLAPVMSGRLRFGHTSSNTVASDAATAGPPAHRPALSPFQIVEGPCVEDQPEAGADTGRRSAVTSPRTSRISTPAFVTSWCARRSALSTISMPVTCQPPLGEFDPPDSAAGAGPY